MSYNRAFEETHNTKGAFVPQIQTHDVTEYSARNDNDGSDIENAFLNAREIIRPIAPKQHNVQVKKRPVTADSNMEGGEIN